MDNELLKKVLTENQRIIIPALGIFLRKEQCGTLVFNPFLKKDDGKLSAIVELEYGVSSDEAKEIIEQYTDKVRTILKAKSKYYIDGLGALVVDSNGVISFSTELPPPLAPTPEPQLDTQQAPSQPVAPQPISKPTEVNIAGNQPFNQSQANFRAQYSQPSASIPQPIAQPRPAQPVATQSQQPFMQSSSMSPSASPFSRPAPAPKPTIPGQPIATTQQSTRPTEQINSTQATRPVAPHIPNATQPQSAPRRQAPKNGKRAPRAIKNSTKKGDMWLVIAIAAAAIVIVLMVIGIINSSQLAALNLQ